MYKELLKLEEEGLIKTVFTVFRNILETSSLKKIRDSLNLFLKREMFGGGVKLFFSVLFLNFRFGLLIWVRLTWNW